MYGSLFSRDLFAELDRLQRDAQRSLNLSPSIRGIGRSGFPAFNIGSTAQSVELFAFAPGLDPDSIDVRLDRGLLTVAGRREAGAGRPANRPRTKTAMRAPPCTSTNGSAARSAARLRCRTTSTPTLCRPATRNGVLRIGVKRKEAVKPRRIAVNA